MRLAHLTRNAIVMLSVGFLEQPRVSIDALCRLVKLLSMADLQNRKIRI